MGSTSKPSTIRERVIEFEKEFTDQLEKIEKQIMECGKEIENLQLELKFVTEEEYPKATETRILSGDPTEANKLKKLMDKLQDQIRDKQEDLVVYHNIKDRFIAEKVEESRDFIIPFNEEKRANTSAQYEKMLKAKRAYLETIQEESKPLHDFQAADLKLQHVLSYGGVVKPLSGFPLDLALKHGERMFHNNVYLAVTNAEATRFIRQSPNTDDLDYLPTK